MLALVVDVADRALDGGDAVPRRQQPGVLLVALDLHVREGPGVGEARGLEVVAAAAVGGGVGGGERGGGAGEARGGGGAGCFVAGERPGGGLGAALGGFGAAAGGAEAVEEGGGGLQGLRFLEAEVS